MASSVAWSMCGLCHRPLENTKMEFKLDMSTDEKNKDDEYINTPD